MKYSFGDFRARSKSYLLLWLLLLLPVVGQGQGSNVFSLGPSRYLDTDNSNYYFSLDFSFTPAVAPPTYDVIVSPHGYFTFSPDGGPYSVYIYNDLTPVLNELTNGLWQLTLDGGGASPQTYYFTISIGNLSSNDLPAVAINEPANNAIDVSTNLLLTWSGPGASPDYTNIQVDAHDQNYSVYDYFSTLPPATTSYGVDPAVGAPYGAPLLVGYNTADVNYTGATAQMVISTPTNSSGQPLPKWVSWGTLRSSSSSYFYVGQPPPLVARYTFDQTSNLGNDSSGNNNNAQGSGGYLGAQPLISTNLSAQGSWALYSPGGSWLELPGPVQSALEGSFSVAVWLRTTNHSNTGNDSDSGTDGAGILAAANGGATNEVIPMAQTGDLLAFYTGDSETTLHSIHPIDTGAFVHVVVSRDMVTGQRKVYINGALDNADVGGTNLLNGLGSVYLPWNTDSGGTYSGIMDDLQIYGGVIGDSNAMYLYQNPGSIITNLPPSESQSDYALALALSATNLNWTTFGDASWFVETTNVSYPSTAAAQSGGVTGPQFSTLTTTVTGPGQLTFVWSSIANDPNGGFNYIFYLDGDTNAGYEDNLTGDQDWYQDGIFDIPPGQHTLNWTVFANGDTDATEAGFLDRVSYDQFTAPVITSNPLDQTNSTGYPVWLAAAASGNPAPTWQWYKVGTGAIANANQDFLIPTNSGQAGVAGTYYAIAQNSVSSATTSNAVVAFQSDPPPPPWSVAKGPAFHALYTTNIAPNYYLGCAADSLGDVYVAAQYYGAMYVNINFSITATNSFTEEGAFGSSGVVKYSPNGTPLWGFGLTNDAYVTGGYAECVAPAPGDGVYLASTLFQTNFVGPDQISISNGYSVLLTRFDANGNVLWSQLLNASQGGYNPYNCLVSDAAGNVTVAGFASGTLTAGTNSVSIYGPQFGYVFQFDPNGHVRWAEDFPEVALNLAIGGNQLYVSFPASTSGGVTNLSFGSISNLTDREYGVAALNETNGQPIWVKGVGETYGSDTRGLSDDIPLISAYGADVYLVGTAYGTNAKFDNLTVPLEGARAQYFARYDTNGNAEVANSFGGPNAMPWSASANASGVYMSGDFNNYAFFGPDLIAAPAETNDLGSLYFSQPFVAKLDRNGNPLWAQYGTSSYEANFRGVAAVPGGVWACGFLRIEDSILPATFGTNDVFSEAYLFNNDQSALWTEGGLLTKIIETPTPEPVLLIYPQRSGTNFNFSFLSAENASYTIQTSTNLASGAWSSNSMVIGNGLTLTNSIGLPVNGNAIYVRVQSN